MTMPLRPEADALRIGMLAGIFTRGDVVTWADLAIAELDKPCGELIDLSTSEGLDGSSFAALLGSIPGEADLGLTKRILLARLGEKLAKGADLASLAPSLAQLAELVPFTDEEKQLAGRLGPAGPADEQKRDAAKLLAGCEETRLRAG
jgi:hypothetical protein